MPRYLDTIVSREMLQVVPKSSRGSYCHRCRHRFSLFTREKAMFSGNLLHFQSGPPLEKVEESDRPLSIYRPPSLVTFCVCVLCAQSANPSALLLDQASSSHEPRLAGVNPPDQAKVEELDLAGPRVHPAAEQRLEFQLGSNSVPAGNIPSKMRGLGPDGQPKETYPCKICGQRYSRLEVSIVWIMIEPSARKGS